MKRYFNMNKNYIFLTAIFLLIGCGNDDIQKETFLKVSNSKLIYRGEIEDKAELKFKRENDTIKWFVRMAYIMEGDMLNSVTVSTINEDLTLRIITKPYNNPYWYDIDKLTKVHDVEFDVTGLKAGIYDLNLEINNTYSHWDNLSIN